MPATLKSRPEFLEKIRVLAEQYGAGHRVSALRRSPDLRRVEHETLAAFRSYLGDDDEYTRQLEEILARKPPRGLDILDQTKADDFIGLVTAVANIIEGDWDKRNEAVIRGRMHVGILEHAEVMLCDPSVAPSVAAAVAGVVLEHHLVAMCANRDVERTRGRSGGIDRLSAALKGRGVYDNEQHQRVLLWNTLRNKGVHADGPVEIPAVREMIAGVRAFIGKYPV